MSKQCLDVQQMQHLQELGLDTINASMCWIKDMEGNQHLSVHDEYCYEARFMNPVPAYTLQDVLDALPLQVEIPLHPERGKYELRIKRMVFKKGRVMYAVVYEKEDYIDWIVLYSDEVLIDAAYSLLCWLIENKFVETNKNE